jgi:proteasome accessory factor A
VPKAIGYDGEVGNFISGSVRSGSTGREASRALIREIAGGQGCFRRFLLNCTCDECQDHWERLQRRHQNSTHHTVDWNTTAVRALLEEIASEKNDHDPRDHNRRYLTENGACIYIDLDHVELCLPETRSVYDHVACWHAGLRILRRAQAAANGRLPDGQKIHVLINNSDGRSNSWGSHMNFLVTRRCWKNIFERKMQYLLYLAAYQASSIVFTGQGKVGSENRAPDVDFQLSQRADFFEQIAGPQTTYARPIVNSRDEAHCGTDDYLRRRPGRSQTGDARPDRPGDDSARWDRAAGSWHWPEPAESDMARLHVIFFDNTLCHVSSLLKAGVMQIVLAMIEAEEVNHRLILDDPVGALKLWSHDPSLRARARMCSGRRVTAVELQSLFLEEATRFVDREILDMWADTLDKLNARDLPALSRRLDWALKLSLLENVLEERPELDWKHPAIKKLDLVYSSLDPDDGLFWAYEADGHIERVVSDADIERFVSNPPEDTRAWTRAMLLRRAGAGRVADVDWDHIRFVVGDDEFNLRHRTVDLADPLEPGRETWGDVFEQSTSFDAVLDAFEQRERVQDKSIRTNG